MLLKILLRFFGAKTEFSIHWNEREILLLLTFIDYFLYNLIQVSKSHYTVIIFAQIVMLNGYINMRH